MMEHLPKLASAAATFTSFLFATVGCSLLWNAINDHTPEDDRYEGLTNVGNYHLVLAFIFFITMSVGVANKGFNVICPHTVKFLAASWSIGLGNMWVAGLLQIPLGFYNWVGFSMGTVNGLRIAIETDENNIVRHEGWPRTEFANYGLAPFAVPRDIDAIDGINGTLAAPIDDDDLRQVISGLVLCFIGGYTAFTLLHGKNWIPFNLAVEADAAAQKANIWKLLVNLGAVGCGFIAVFVLFTSECSANPGHPFYDTVMTMIALGGNTAMMTLIGVAFAEPILIELGIYFAGFFGVYSSVHLHQLETFASVEPIKSAYFPAGGLESLQDLEMNRYRTAATLFTLAAILTVIGGCLSLKGNTGATVASPSTKSHGPIGYALVGFSGLLIFIGLICGWAVVGEALNDSIDGGEADDSRADAANEYIFLVFVAWFGYAIQGFKAVEFLHPMVYLSYGICASMVTGLVNCGTHDRQLWMVDYSLAGLNELRAFLDDDYVGPKRAFNLDQEWFETALAGSLCVWIGMIICYIASFEKPMGGKFAAFKTSKAGLGLAAVSLTCGFIGCVMLWNLDAASPPIRAAASSAVKSDFAAGIPDICKGSTFNVMAVAGQGDCFDAAQNFAGERFSLNTFGLGSNFDMTSAYGQYTTIFFFTAASFIVTMLTLYPVVGGDPRGLKIGLFANSWLWLSLTYAFVWPSGECDDAEHSACTEWKTGFVFLFFQGVTSTLSFLLLLKATEAFDGAAPAAAGADYAAQDNEAGAEGAEGAAERKPSIRQSSI